LTSFRKKENEQSRKLTFHDFDFVSKEKIAKQSRKLTFHDFDLVSKTQKFSSATNPGESFRMEVNSFGLFGIFRVEIRFSKFFRSSTREKLKHHMFLELSR